MSTIEVTDALVLAAVDRAVRHQRTGAPSAVPVGTIYQHVGVSARSGTARELRARLTALEGTALERASRHGIETWTLTRKGKRRLSRLRTNGALPVLPESPQHQAWRQARAHAAERIEEFRIALADAVEHAQELLELPPPTPPNQPSELPGVCSDDWFELGDRLATACRRLGSAGYCLWEWREPEDTKADKDDLHDACDAALAPGQRARRRALRQGRRNTLLWDAGPLSVFIGTAIREQREQRGLTTTELAGKANISERRLTAIETGQTETDYLLFLALARGLDTRTDHLARRARELETQEGPTRPDE